MKSTEARLSWPLRCTVQCRPPSVVARIWSWLTAQPRAAETNWIPVKDPAGNEGTGSAGQRCPAAAGLPVGELGRPPA
jgi:hypothetical protein